MSSPTETFQLSVDQAESYESSLVPAIFGEWAPLLVEAAGVAAGQRVLDVACGTGVVARAAARHAGKRGRVTGLDLNAAMLAVARRLRPDLEWRQGDAADLPFADGSFDAVLCQSALMFFPDPVRALREMARVVATDGRVAVQVWARLERQPGYGPLVQVAARHAGPEAVSLLSAYWKLGDTDALAGLFAAAGLRVTAITARAGTVRLGSVDELVRNEVESTPLRERISDEVYGRIIADAREELGRFRTGAGIAVPIEGLLVTAVPGAQGTAGGRLPAVRLRRAAPPG
ncbi:methyltransferase domain-containing protein [Nonomuraea sp. NPDC003804]|uniref:class I SAM-dependent methyltransferase n=1 Tax=Nonomuraea sp. NPDC003804 TaxID=3154547 RepID=UPI0033A7B774